MKSDLYLGMGLAQVDGNAGWALMRACADGDREKVEELLAADPNLVNVQYWYQIPLHFAVREGHCEIVRELLARGADPTISPYCEGSWGELLEIAQIRGLDEVEDILVAVMSRRFRYSVGFEPLAEAIRAGDRTRVEGLLDHQPELLSQADARGNGPVHWAVLTHQLDLMTELTRRGADLDARRADGRTPILLVIHGDYSYRAGPAPGARPQPPLERIQALLELGAERPLSVAILQGDLEYVRQELEGRPSLADTLDSGRTSPLCYASLAGSVEMTDLLLSHGADPSRPEALAPRGRALYEAAARNQLEQARRLLEAGADPSAQVDSSGDCLWIVEHRHPKDYGAMTELLLRHGARRASWAMSADELREALEQGHEFPDEWSLVQDVLEKDDLGLLDVLLESRPGLAAELDGGAFRSPSVKLVASSQLVDRLLDCGFDLDRGSWVGKTLLHHCARFGDVELAAHCLDRDAAIDPLELEHGGNPLGSAARCGQSEIVKLLLSRGADPSAPADRPWATPKAQARRAGHDGIVELL